MLGPSICCGLVALDVGRAPLRLDRGRGRKIRARLALLLVGICKLLLFVSLAQEALGRTLDVLPFLRLPHGRVADVVVLGITARGRKVRRCGVTLASRRDAWHSFSVTREGVVLSKPTLRGPEARMTAAQGTLLLAVALIVLLGITRSRPLVEVPSRRAVVAEEPQI